MPALSRKEQQEVTSDHLKGDMQIEIWLIPFCITLVIMLTVVIIMVVMHFVKKRRRHENSPHKEYQQANTDSDEMLRFPPSVLNGIAGNNIDTSPNDWHPVNGGSSSNQNDEWRNLHTSDI